MISTHQALFSLICRHVTACRVPGTPPLQSYQCNKFNKLNQLVYVLEEMHQLTHVIPMKVQFSARNSINAALCAFNTIDHVNTAASHIGAYGNDLASLGRHNLRASVQKAVEHTCGISTVPASSRWEHHLFQSWVANDLP